MAELISASAAIVVASLCMPVSQAQGTGRYFVEDITVIEPAQPVLLAGIGVPVGPIVRTTVSYWRGTEKEPRRFTFKGHTDQMDAIIRSGLPPPMSCAPVG